LKTGLTFFQETLSIFSEIMSANQQPTIAAAHDATMAQQQRADNTRGWQSATGNPIFNNIQPPNPNVTPNPTIQQMETIEKAIKILNNHQLLMKFATENKQVSETELVDQIKLQPLTFSGADAGSSLSRQLASTGRKLLQHNSPRG
jgi:hypothetical protein